MSMNDGRIKLVFSVHLKNIVFGILYNDSSS